MKAGDRVVITGGWVGKKGIRRGTFVYADETSYYVELDEDYSPGNPVTTITFRGVYVSPNDVVPEPLYGTKLYKVLA